MLYLQVTLRSEADLKHFGKRSSVEAAWGRDVCPLPPAKRAVAPQIILPGGGEAAKCNLSAWLLHKQATKSQIPSGSITNKYIILYQCCRGGARNAADFWPLASSLCRKQHPMEGAEVNTA